MNEQERQADLSNQCLVRVPPLRGFNTLTNLNISNNAISQCSGLPASLKVLNFSNNLIAELTNLHHLRSLISLDVSHNLLTKCTGLEDCSSLQFLNLRNNEITELLSLGTIPKLSRLDVSRNKIHTSISLREFLSKHPMLMWLNLRGNTVYWKPGLQEKIASIHPNLVVLNSALASNFSESSAGGGPDEAWKDAGTTLPKEFTMIRFADIDDDDSYVNEFGGGGGGGGGNRMRSGSIDSSAASSSSSMLSIRRSSDESIAVPARRNNSNPSPSKNNNASKIDSSLIVTPRKIGAWIARKYSKKENKKEMANLDNNNINHNLYTIDDNSSLSSSRKMINSSTTSCSDTSFSSHWRDERENNYDEEEEFETSAFYHPANQWVSCSSSFSPSPIRFNVEPALASS